MWWALPTSDYYGGSVAILDIQRHLPWARALGIFHLSALRIDRWSFQRRQSPVNAIGRLVDGRIRFRFFGTGSPARHAESFDNPLFGDCVQRFPHRRSQANFLRPPGKGTRNLRSANTALSLYPLVIAVQSCPIAYGQLTAFQACYVPVSAFAFRLA